MLSHKEINKVKRTGSDKQLADCLTKGTASPERLMWVIAGLSHSQLFNCHICNLYMHVYWVSKKNAKCLANDASHKTIVMSFILKI